MVKTYYAVTTTYDDKGRVTAQITDTVRAEVAPQNSSLSTNKVDVYIDWFATRTEAQQYIEEAKNA